MTLPYATRIMPIETPVIYIGRLRQTTHMRMGLYAALRDDQPFAGFHTQMRVGPAICGSLEAYGSTRLSPCYLKHSASMTGLALGGVKGPHFAPVKGGQEV